MTTLRKTENTEDIFTVTVESSVDMTTFAKSYEESNPETDIGYYPDFYVGLEIK